MNSYVYFFSAHHFPEWFSVRGVKPWIWKTERQEREVSAEIKFIHITPRFTPMWSWPYLLHLSFLSNILRAPPRIIRLLDCDSYTILPLTIVWNVIHHSIAYVETLILLFILSPLSFSSIGFCLFNRSWTVSLNPSPDASVCLISRFIVTSALVFLIIISL